MWRLTFGAPGAYLRRCWKGNRCSLARTVRASFFSTCLTHQNVDVNQFSIITELLGTPPDDVIETIASENVGPASPRYYRFLTPVTSQTLRFVQSLPKRERVPFSQKLRTTDKDG